jgi:hypothetical protein
MQDTTTCFGLVNGPSSGCSQNLWGDCALGVVNVWVTRSRLILTLYVVICPFVLGQFRYCHGTYIHVQCASFFTCPKLAALHDLPVLGSFTKLRNETTSLVMCVCLSVCRSAWNKSAPTGWILIKIHVWVFFEISSKLGVWRAAGDCTL